MYTLNEKNVAAANPPPPGSEGIPPHWTTYLASDDVDQTARRIETRAAPSWWIRSTSSTPAG